MIEFRAPWPLSSPHLQTIGAALPWHVRPPARARTEALRIPISGGALHASAWWNEGAKPAVILVHGVGGSIDSQYVARAARAFFDAGFHAIRLNQRGAGDSLADAPSLYHGGLTADLRAALVFLAARSEITSRALVGFSLGGNTTLDLAAEDDARSLADAFVAVSAPLDLAVVSRLLNRPLNFPYSQFILNSLKRQAFQFADRHPQLATFDRHALRGAHSLWAYDDIVVAPMHGFGTAERYYARVSSGQYLPKIAARTLLIHAEDDPLVPGHTVRPFLSARARSVEVAWSNIGGHVGWFSGLGEVAWLRTWAMERALEFVRRPA